MTEIFFAVMIHIYEIFGNLEVRVSQSVSATDPVRAMDSPHVDVDVDHAQERDNPVDADEVAEVFNWRDHVHNLTLVGTNYTFQCSFCDRVVKGGRSRFIEHLVPSITSRRRQIRGCLHCPKEVKQAVLAQPASSSSAEQSWSRYDYVHNKRRNRLKSERASQLVYVYENLKLVYKFGSYKRHLDKQDTQHVSPKNIIHVDDRVDGNASETDVGECGPLDYSDSE